MISIYKISDGITDFIADHPVGTALGATGAAAGAVLGTAAVVGLVKSGKSKRRKTRGSRKRITHTKRGWKQDRKRKSKQKWEVAYRKRKKKHSSSKRRGRVYYARKTGQPYILLANGKAKFIKGKRR